jgi:tetratricopeptide (TPR) repeat protein
MAEKEASSTTTSQKSVDYIVENFSVIWLDSNMDQLKDSVTKLRRAVKYVQTFDEQVMCVTFLKETKDKKIFLILSGTVSNIVIPLVHDMTQLVCIYILSNDATKHKHLMGEWKKVKGVFDNILFICVRLIRRIEYYEDDFSSISILSPSSVIDLNELDPSFMYTRLLKEVLLDMEHNAQTKAEFIEFCRVKCAATVMALTAIDEFEHDYEHHSSIWWYTKEPFIYSILNRALRIQDVDIVLKMGFFIQNLHKEIEQIHSKTSQKEKQKIYRGQRISNVELEKLKISEGGLLSFNTFLSTSTNYSISYLFADSVRDDPEGIGIIFEAEIGPEISSYPFASLDDVSVHSNLEQEILFSMHTVFRIGEIEPIEDRLWYLKLTLTNDSDEQLTGLTDYIRCETKELTNHHRLGTLMIKMGEFEKAQQFFQNLLATTPTDDWSLLARLHQQLGSVYQSKGNTTLALTNYDKSLQFTQNNPSSVYPLLAMNYNHIGESYDWTNDYSTALSYFEKALELQQKNVSTSFSDMAITYNNIGDVNKSIGNFTTALLYYQRALEFLEKTLPSTHPDIANTLNSMGTLYVLMGDFPNAQLHHQKALNIQQKALPSTHTDLVTTYSNLGSVYDLMGDYSNALLSYERTLEIRQKILPSNHSYIANTYNNIGGVYRSLSNYSTALSYHEKALEFNKKFLRRII